MASTTSQTNDSQGKNPLSNDLQDDAPNVATVGDPPQGQRSTSNLERCFSNMYSFQISVMSNLNRLDFKNLQLAGVQTPVSHQVQRKYLIPSKCDEKLGYNSWGAETCANTTRTVKEIKACQGLRWDVGEWEGGQPEKWVEPRFLKHVRASARMKSTKGDEGGNFDSLNVCIHCHDRARRYRRSYQKSNILGFHSTMCRSHCLEYTEQRPYNTCHCDMLVDDSWRCHECSMSTIYTLKRRADEFDSPHVPLALSPWDMWPDRSHHLKCPIRDCTGDPWLTGPSEQQMWLCRACTCIFPSINRTFAD